MLDYIIPIAGLGLGKHQFVFEIDSAFLKRFPALEIEEGQVSVETEMVKESNLIDFSFRFIGRLLLPCDRCLEYFYYPVDQTFRLIVKYGETREEISDEILVIPANESRLDLSQYFYEFLNLTIPFKKEHPLDENGHSTCNKEMEEKLKSMTIKSDDSRWDALKNIELD